MTNYYIEEDNKIILFDTDKQRLENTLAFQPQYVWLEIQETERPIVDFEFADTAEYIEAQASKEAERVGRLKMTKLDFFKYVVAPTGTSYAQLLEAVGSNDLLKATWDLCNHVYRGDEVMNTYATDLLGVSAEQLDEIFKERGE